MSRSRTNEENNKTEFLTPSTTNMREAFEHIAKVYESGENPPTVFICSFLEYLESEGWTNFNLANAIKLMKESKPSDEQHQEFTKFGYWDGGFSWWDVNTLLDKTNTLRRQTILKEKARFIRTVILPQL